MLRDLLFRGRGASSGSHHAAGLALAARTSSFQHHEARLLRRRQVEEARPITSAPAVEGPPLAQQQQGQELQWQAESAGAVRWTPTSVSDEASPSTGTGTVQCGTTWGNASSAAASSLGTASQQQHPDLAGGADGAAAVAPHLTLEPPPTEAAVQHDDNTATAPAQADHQQQPHAILRPPPQPESATLNHGVHVTLQPPLAPAHPPAASAMVRHASAPQAHQEDHPHQWWQECLPSAHSVRAMQEPSSRRPLPPEQESDDDGDDVDVKAQPLCRQDSLELARVRWAKAGLHVTHPHRVRGMQEASSRRQRPDQGLNDDGDDDVEVMGQLLCRQDSLELARVRWAKAGLHLAHPHPHHHHHHHHQQPASGASKHGSSLQDQKRRRHSGAHTEGLGRSSAGSALSGNGAGAAHGGGGGGFLPLLAAALATGGSRWGSSISGPHHHQHDQHGGVASSAHSGSSRGRRRSLAAAPAAAAALATSAPATPVAPPSTFASRWSLMTTWLQRHHH